MGGMASVAGWCGWVGVRVKRVKKLTAFPAARPAPSAGRVLKIANYSERGRSLSPPVPPPPPPAATESRDWGLRSLRPPPPAARQAGVHAGAPVHLSVTWFCAGGSGVQRAS